MWNEEYAVVAIVVLAGSGCNPASVTNVRDSGNSVNYKFESSKQVDQETGECRHIEVRVRPKAKMYANAKEPPSRLTVIDTDCKIPFDVEQARYVADGGVMLSGRAMNQVRSQYRKLFHELHVCVHDVVRSGASQ